MKKDDLRKKKQTINHDIKIFLQYSYIDKIYKKTEKEDEKHKSKMEKKTNGR